MEMYFLATKGCDIGGADLSQFMSVFRLIITIIQWAVPVALMLWGSIDLFKSITTGKDEEIKKKQILLLKKVLSAVIVFLLPWLIFSIMDLIGVDFGTCYKNSKAGIPTIGTETSE